MKFLSKFLTFSGVALAALVTMPEIAEAASEQAVSPSDLAKVQLAQFQDVRPRITVLPLSHGDIRSEYWWWNNFDRGEGAAKGITELLVNEIVNNGTYALLDSSQFSTQDGSDVDESKVLKSAEEQDLDAVLMGTITQFDLKNNNRCIRVPFRGRVCSKETKATVKLNVRLVDPVSKTVLATAQGEGDARSNSFDLDFYSRIPDVNSDEQKAVDEILSEATEKAIGELVPALAEAQDKF